MRPRTRFAGVAAAAALSLLLLLPAAHGRAGLSGQPQPSADLTARIRNATRQFLIDGGDVGKARPDLLILVEQNPLTDVSDLYAPALRDGVLYNGLVDLLNEQTGKAAESDRPYVIYNLARTHLLRARLFTTSQRIAFLDAASKAAAKFPSTLRDPGAWELKGDIDAERGDVDAATAAYNRVISSGGSRAFAQYKIAQAMVKANRLGPSERAYQDALRSSAAEGGKQMPHLIYQGLADLYLRQGNDPAALDALARSARATPEPDSPFRFRTDVARRLLQRGHNKEVLAFAEAALRASPDDEEAKALREAAQQGGTRRR